MAEPKLKPCPFCGEKAILQDYGDYSGLNPTIYCSGCTCKMITKNKGMSEAIPALIRAWNRRVK